MARGLWDQVLAHIRARAALHPDDIPMYAARAGVDAAALRGACWALYKRGALDVCQGFFVLAPPPAAVERKAA
jgi:hypothetical protein